MEHKLCNNRILFYSYVVEAYICFRHNCESAFMLLERKLSRVASDYKMRSASDPDSLHMNSMYTFVELCLNLYVHVQFQSA